jgi:hypothetical protein
MVGLFLVPPHHLDESIPTGQIDAGTALIAML